MKKEAYHISADELYRLGKDAIPSEFIPACHLIYSSPATLAYNSPGAVGFGVKRAGLVIPESVMLLVGPACCGRNSTILSSEEGYADRMFYLQMDEADLVTGHHLDAIIPSVKEILETVSPRPSVVVICTTCVDALLATDLESICLEATAECGAEVVPCYMYALTREGRKPPMTLIRQTVYSLLKKQKRDPASVNIMGFFTGLDPENEMFAMLRKAGVKNIYEIGNMTTLEEYHRISSSNFSIVLDPESNYAAEYMKDKLGIPYIEMARIYSPERIHRQYELFSAAVGIEADDSLLYKEALERKKRFSERFAGKSIGVGEMANGNAFELAAFFAECGLDVKGVFSNVTEYDFPFIKRLAGIAPEVPVYSGISPSMINYEPLMTDIAIGKDGCIYCDAAGEVRWNSEVQPFGYKGLFGLLDAIEEVMS